MALPTRTLIRYDLIGDRYGQALTDEQLAETLETLETLAPELADGDALAAQAGALLGAPGRAGADVAAAAEAWYSSTGGERRPALTPGARMKPEAARQFAGEARRRLAVLRRAVADATEAAAQGRLRELARQQRLEQLVAEVTALLDPAVVEQLAQAQAAAEQALGDLATAEQRLQEHEATTPDATQRHNWARKRGTLAGELEGFQLLEARARTALATAQSAYDVALGDLWRAQVAQARAQVAQAHQERQQRIAEAEAALVQAKDAAAALVLAAEASLGEVRAAAGELLA